MSNILLASQNAIGSSVSWYGNGDAAMPLTNLADDNFSNVWRYTPAANADGNTAKILFTLGSPARCGHVAFCRHNLSEAAQIRVRAGMARLDVDFTTDNTYSPAITYGGGANGTRTNEYGVMVAGTCPRLDHDRRYFENGFKYSEDLSQSDWSVLDARKYSDGTTVAFEKVGGTSGQIYQVVPNLYADSYELKAQVRLVSGDGSFCFKIGDGVSNIQGSTKTATAAWQWFSDSITAAGATTDNDNGAIQKLTAAGVLQIRKLQIRRGASSGKYRKTTSARLYQRIGVITEAAATNSLLHSSDLSNAAWTKGGTATVTPNTHTAPDGTLSMDTLSAAANGDHAFQAFSAAGTSPRATSFVFKAGSSTSVNATLYISWYTGGVLQTVACVFNPSTGAYISSTSSGATLRAAGVKDLGGGFFRAYVIGVGTDAANTLVRTYLEITAAGVSIVAWGFQNEATYVTTYIPTTTAAVTRTVDTAVVEPTTWVPYALNASEGTIYHEATPDDINPGSSLRIASMAVENSAGPFTNEVMSSLYYLVGFGYISNTLVFNGGAGTWNISSGVVPSSAAARSAIRYRVSDFQLFVNGTAVASASITVPSMNRINLMRDVASTAYLRRVTIWPTGKSNTDLQALTTSGPSAIDYDSGWDDVLQMSMAGDVSATWGHDYNVIKTFSDRALEQVQVEMYDPAKTGTSTPFECGRIFMGKLTLQPARNAQFGLANEWIERSTFTEATSGRKFFNELNRIRQVALAFPELTHAEGAKLHEMQGAGGIVEETLYLPDPSDEGKCQQYGFVGRLSKLDPLVYPMVNIMSAAVQIEQKR